MMRWEPACHKIEWQRHCVLRNCSSALSIYSSSHISERSPMRGGRLWTVNTTHSPVPTGFQRSQLDLTMGYEVSDKTSFFFYIILWLGKTIKHLFLFLAIQEANLKSKHAKPLRNNQANTRRYHLGHCVNYTDMEVVCCMYVDCTQQQSTYSKEGHCKKKLTTTTYPYFT